jgi:hypothetical protein
LYVEGERVETVASPRLFQRIVRGHAGGVSDWQLGYGGRGGGGGRGKKKFLYVYLEIIEIYFWKFIEICLKKYIDICLEIAFVKVLWPSMTPRNPPHSTCF